MRVSHYISALTIPLVLAACAQPETPPSIQGQLLLDKMGNEVGCVEGVFIPGAPMQYQCRVPDEVCDPQFANWDPDCLPPRDVPPNGGQNGGPAIPGRQAAAGN